MNIEMYVSCFLVALTGWALQTSLKIKSLETKAKLANVVFEPWKYFKDDWLSVTSSILTIVLFLFFIDEVMKINAKVIDYIKIGFAFVGYTGSDVASRLFSVVNKRINSAIDYKTTIADTQSGTLDNPTPAK